LSDYIITFDTLLIPQLAELELRSTIPISRLFDFLSRHPLLETLRLYQAVRSKDDMPTSSETPTLEMTSMQYFHLEGDLYDVSPLLRLLRRIYSPQVYLSISRVDSEALSDVDLLEILQVLGSSARALPFDTVTFRAGRKQFWLSFKQSPIGSSSSDIFGANWTITPWCDFTSIPDEHHAPLLAAHILRHMPRDGIRELILQTELAYPQHDWLSVSWISLARLEVYGQDSLDHLLEHTREPVALSNHSNPQPQVLLPQLNHLVIVKAVVDKEAFGEWIMRRSALRAPVRTVDFIRCDGFKRRAAREFRDKFGLMGTWERSSHPSDSSGSALLPA
jgi:hypothetical protein